MSSPRRRSSIIGAALSTLVLAMTAPASGQAATEYNIGSLEAYNAVETAAEFSGGAARVVFVSRTDAGVDGHLYDVSYDGACALVSITVNDGYADRQTFRVEKCGVDRAYGKFVERAFRSRVRNVKVAVGFRYPHNGLTRWGESVKFANPYR
jgi:hypothetical protein